MEFPRIHLNGSHGPTLLAQYLDAATAASEALKLLQAIDVNGRDYYVVRPNAANIAMVEHSARCAALRAIFNDLCAIAEHIDTQIGERAPSPSPSPSHDTVKAELLAALKALLFDCEHGNGAGTWEGHKEQARAAIAKAESDQ
jgi:hypothetical protein